MAFRVRKPSSSAAFSLAAPPGRPGSFTAAARTISGQLSLMNSNLSRPLGSMACLRVVDMAVMPSSEQLPYHVTRGAVVLGERLAFEAMRDRLFPALTDERRIGRFVVLHPLGVGGMHEALEIQRATARLVPQP